MNGITSTQDGHKGSSLSGTCASDPPSSSPHDNKDVKNIPICEAYPSAPTERNASSHEVQAPVFADLDLADWLDSIAPHAEPSSSGTTGQHGSTLTESGTSTHDTQAVPGSNACQHVPADERYTGIDVGQEGGFPFDGLEADIFKLEAMETDEIETAVESGASSPPQQADIPISISSDPGPCCASEASRTSMGAKDIQTIQPLATPMPSTTMDLAEGVDDLIPGALPDHEIALRQAEAAEEALAGERVDAS